VNALEILSREGAPPVREEWPPPDRDALVTSVLVPPERQPALACLAKRTYAIVKGRLELADVQDALVGRPRAIVDTANGTSYLDDDGDLVAPKPATDVVLRGSAIAPSPVRELYVAVAVGASVRRLRVCGPRIAEIGADGRARFSEPELFERCELEPTRAYGGCDLYAQNTLERGPNGRPLAELPEKDVPKRAGWLYQYPRNPVGTGFFIDVDRARAHGAELPRIEEPSTLLTPDQLFLPNALAWHAAPIPGLMGFVDHSWYPRCARLLGIAPDHGPPTAEAEARFADGKDLPGILASKALRVSSRALQGAAPGLAVERLRGDEVVLLTNVHRSAPTLKLTLPGESPRMRLKVPKLRTYELSPVLQTLRLELDRDRVSLTWCGTVRLVTQVPVEFLKSCELSLEWRKES